MQASADPAFRGQLLRDPGLFPQKVDFLRQAMLLVQLSRSDLAGASFLDDRILSSNSRGKWVRLERVATALAGASPSRPLHFIFHAGHVGSTLLSRLLEEAGGVLALREPLPLRSLAEAHDALASVESLLSPGEFDNLVRMQVLLWSRGYDDTRAVVVKATSTATRVAPRLLTVHPQAQAVCLNLGLEAYLEALLSGENSWVDLRGHAAERARRLRAMGAPLDKPLYAMSLGELAAQAWVAEKLTQQRLGECFGTRVLHLDFNAMLADVSGVLREVCNHLKISAAEDFFRNAPSSAALQRYAKAPDAPYSPELRAQLMQQARALHSKEISSGQRWAETLARRSPAAAAALGSL